MNPTWRALAREAAIAAEHIAIGATALSKADFFRHAYYSQAFFALSIGFERASKLVLAVDHAVEHNGIFPATNTLRCLGHDLRSLLDATDEVALRRKILVHGCRLPRTSTHDSIIKVLSDFANNLTRYYNLSLVTRDPGTAGVSDPVKAWFDAVITPILVDRYGTRQRARHQRVARINERLLGNHALVRYTNEVGEKLDSVEASSLWAAQIRFAAPYARMHVMQMARFLGAVLSELGHAGHKLREPLIPDFSEFFAIFNNEDKYFLRRRTWSIYRR